MSDAGPLSSLISAAVEYYSVLSATPATPPNLQGVVLQAPDPPGDHARLHPGAELPPLPVALREKTLLDAYFIPLVPATKVYYFGKERWLARFRDLSRVTLAALRQSFPDVDELAERVLYDGPPRDAEHILADCSLLILRDAIADAPGRKFVMERWLWGSSPTTERIPFYADERRAWLERNPGAVIPSLAPDVTTFTHDLFTFQAFALYYLIRRLAPPEQDDSRDERASNGKPKKPSANDPRDDWMYGEYIKGTPLSEILCLLHDKSRKLGWEDFDHAPAVTMAMGRAAERWGIPKPKHGQGVDHRAALPPDDPLR
jgi:hypothetical protein